MQEVKRIDTGQAAKPVAAKAVNAYSPAAIKSVLPTTMQSEWKRRQAMLPVNMRRDLDMQIGAFLTRLKANPNLVNMLNQMSPVAKQKVLMEAFYLAMSGLDLGPEGMNKAEVWMIPYGGQNPTIGVFPSVDGYMKIGKHVFGIRDIDAEALTSKNAVMSFKLGEKPVINVDLTPNRKPEDYVAAIAYCEIPIADGKYRYLHYYLDQSEQNRIFGGLSGSMNANNKKTRMAQIDPKGWLIKTAMKHLMLMVIRKAVPVSGDASALEDVIFKDDEAEGLHPGMVYAEEKTVTERQLKSDILPTAVKNLKKRGLLVDPNSVGDECDAVAFELYEHKLTPNAIDWIKTHKRAAEAIKKLDESIQVELEPAGPPGLNPVKYLVNILRGKNA